MEVHCMVPKNRVSLRVWKLKALNEKKHTILNDAVTWLMIFMYATEGLLTSANLISDLILLSIPPICQNITYVPGNPDKRSNPKGICIVWTTSCSMPLSC